MRANFSRVQKINPELIPPAGSVACGITPGGNQLYRLVTRRSRAVPDIDPETGNQRWRKNQMTGEPLYPVNKPELYDDEQIFYLESQGNGNVSRIPWHPPTAEDMARAEKAQRVSEMQEKLAEALVESGMEPNELLASLRGRVSPPVTTTTGAPTNVTFTTNPGVTVTETSYPVLSSPGRWKLSNGSVMQGKRVEAEEAEQRLQEARLAAAVTPEE